MARPKGRRPGKPNRNFPLFPHVSGSWTAVIDGRQRSFGGWSKDPRGVLAKQRYDEFIKAQREGRRPAAIVSGVLSVEDLFGSFLSARLADLDAGRLEPRSYQEYKSALGDFASMVGAQLVASDLRPEHFGTIYDAWNDRLGPHALNRNITLTRSAFRWAEKNRLIDRSPWYGDRFEQVAAKHLRRAARESEAANGKRMFTPAEIAAVLRVPIRKRKQKGVKQDPIAGPTIDPQLRAMFLLGLNCGFLAIDCARLTAEAMDLQAGSLSFVRQKTETRRAAALWPETVEAIKLAIASRPQTDDAELSKLAFLTKYRRPWVHDTITRTEVGIKKVRRGDAINLELGKLLRLLGIHRKGVNFASLRRTFRTFADELNDHHAAALVMGHVPGSVASLYVQQIDHHRLQRIANHVRDRAMSDYLKSLKPTADSVASTASSAKRRPAKGKRRPSPRAHA